MNVLEYCFLRIIFTFVLHSIKRENKVVVLRFKVVDSRTDDIDFFDRDKIYQTCPTPFAKSGTEACKPSLQVTDNLLTTISGGRRETQCRMSIIIESVTLI